MRYALFLLSVILLLVGLSFGSPGKSVVGQRPNEAEAMFWHSIHSSSSDRQASSTKWTSDSVQQYPLYEQGLSARVGDLNHDGLNDVALTTATGRLRLWLQNPICHQLQEKADIETIPVPRDLALGDLNSDGMTDMVLVGQARSLGAGPFPGFVYLYYQQSDGFATTPITYSVGANPRRIKIGDLNSDGKPDLAVSSNNNLDVLIQQPNAVFSQTVVADPAIGAPYDIAISDFNHDGRYDIALQGMNANPNVAIYLQRPDGNGFETGYFLPPVAAGIPWGGWGMTAGDVNGDHLADIVSTIPYNMPTAQLVIYTQLPAGGFTSPSYVPTYEIPTNPTLFDMNDDGRLDVVVLNDGYGAYTVHYQQSDGSLSAPVTRPAGEIQSIDTRDVDIGDVTGDGQPDLIYVGLNTGLTLATSGTVPVCPTPQPPPAARQPDFLYGQIDGIQGYEMVVGDVNGDELQDFLTLCDDQGTRIQIVQQQPGGTFTLSGSILLGQVFPPAGTLLRGLSAGDLNSDGRLDVAAAQPLYEATDIVIALQNTDGTYLPATRRSIALHPSQTYIADWTGDGRNDLAVIASDGLYVLAQQLDGTLADPVLHAAGMIGTTSWSTMTDWNKDGRMDVIAWWDGGLSEAATVRVLLQSANGSFQLLPPRSFPDTPRDLQVGDVNQDGHPDIVLSLSRNRPLGTVWVLLQMPDGNLGNRVLLSAPNYDLPEALAIADLNGDQLNDILVMNAWTYFSVFTQNRSQTFDPIIQYQFFTLNGYSPHSIAQIDVDHNSVPEVLGIASPDGYLAFLKPIPPKAFLPLVKR